MKFYLLALLLVMSEVVHADSLVCSIGTFRTKDVMEYVNTKDPEAFYKQFETVTIPRAKYDKMSKSRREYSLELDIKGSKFSIFAWLLGTTDDTYEFTLQSYFIDESGFYKQLIGMGDILYKWETSPSPDDWADTSPQVPGVPLVFRDTTGRIGLSKAWIEAAKAAKIFGNPPFTFEVIPGHRFFDFKDATVALVSQGLLKGDEMIAAKLGGGCKRTK